MRVPRFFVRAAQRDLPPSGITVTSAPGRMHNILFRPATARLAPVAVSCVYMHVWLEKRDAVT